MKKYLLPVVITVISLTAFQAFALSLPAATGLFETSLQGRITYTDSSMILTSTTTRGGGALPTGYNCFTIDEGLSNAEWVCGTLTSAKTVTGLTRGINSNTGTTTNSALQFGHRVGADVKITDFPLIQMLKAILSGQDTIPNLLSYTAGTACSGSSANAAICDKAYIDGVAVAGASNANETTKGIVEAATQIEMASSTSLGGTGASLYIQAKYATSSPTGTFCGVCVPITQNDGKISPNFIATSSSYAYLWGASMNLNGTTTVSANSLTNGAFSLNGIKQKWFSALPAATSSMMIDASGNVTTYRPDFILLASTTISSGIASTTITIGATSTDLRVVIDVPATSFAAGDNFSIQFNGDTGSNYSWSLINQAAAATNAGTTQVIRLAGNPGAATYAFVSQIDIVNDFSRGKTVTFKSAEAALAVAGSAVGEGFWNNTTQVINTITFGAQTQIPAGTRISVYGSNQ